MLKIPKVSRGSKRATSRGKCWKIGGCFNCPMSTQSNIVNCMIDRLEIFSTSSPNFTKDVQTMGGMVHVKDTSSSE
jgi:hypothetical protein